MGKIRQADIDRTTEFFECEKTLEEHEPCWFKLQNGRWYAVWPILDNLSNVRGALNFRVDPKYADYPSVSLIFEDHPVCRFDTAPDHVVKPNPPWAFGCPPTVRGNHIHTWQDNRDHILRIDNWLFQARQQGEPAVKRVPHLLRSFANHINLSLYGAQYGFDFNPKQDMFGAEA